MAMIMVGPWMFDNDVFGGGGSEGGGVPAGRTGMMTGGLDWLLLTPLRRLLLLLLLFPVRLVASTYCRPTAATRRSSAAAPAEGTTSA